jgi:hypothetical protein
MPPLRKPAHSERMQLANGIMHVGNLGLQTRSKKAHTNGHAPGPGNSRPQADRIIDPRVLADALKLAAREKITEASEAELGVIDDYIELACFEAARDRRLQPDALPPKRDLSCAEMEALKAQGRKYRWEDRKESDPRSAVQWVLDHYGTWLDGLLTNHIRQADDSLYPTFMKEISRKGLPDGVDIPSSEENKKRRQSQKDQPQDVRDLLGRRWHADRTRTKSRNARLG